MHPIRAVVAAVSLLTGGSCRTSQQGKWVRYFDLPQIANGTFCDGCLESEEQRKAAEIWRAVLDESTDAVAEISQTEPWKSAMYLAINNWGNV
jgi:hypothetical protein